MNNKIKLKIIQNGILHVLKTCPGCGDDWYVKPKHNRCSLCGCGLIVRTNNNIEKNYDELRPDITYKEIKKFIRSFINPQRTLKRATSKD